MKPPALVTAELRVEMIGTVPRIVDSKGTDIMTVPGGPERLVACANAMRGIFYPANHISETEAYVKRLEQLRKDAWARAQELEAQINSHAGQVHA